MTTGDATGVSSDKPPKSFLKKINASYRKLSRLHAHLLVGALVLINAGVLHLFARQVSLTASAQMLSEVKDETITVPSADAVNDQHSPEVTDDQSQVAITTYTVASGDTLSGIAQKFGISINTIRWANDLTKNSLIKVGDELVILPFSGIEYTVKKGDTLSGITVKYGGDEKEIMDINGLDDEKDIKPGDKLLIPDGEMPTATPPSEQKTSSSSSTPTPSKNSDTNQTTQPHLSEGYFAMPIPGSILTQGLHAVNAVDFGAPVGTRVLAAADGTILIAKQGGYNGGFGSYIVINHPNGTQTLYAHLSEVEVSVGSKVTQGEEIAKSGDTGKSTGPHMHFEVHGATNPWTKYKVGTHF
ncbi:MAG TPA: peptidoglycan DD-metalloendopeptidase family protein [Candidatus Paceibacterota bacterium]|nr:peptidoglycan DD-metalloendopeptidase family protein [Candidatus Paceibacterota bacterium]